MEIIDIIIEFVNAFLHIYIAYLFCALFGERRCRRHTSIITIVICTVLLAVSLLFLKGNILIYIPMIVLTFSLALLFDSKIGNKILYTILYLVIPGVVEMLVGFFISTAFQISIDIAKDNTTYYISGMLLSKLVVFLIVLFIRTSKQNSLLQHYKNYYLSVFLFPASTLAVAIVQHKIFLEYPNQDMLTKYWVLISYTILIIANIIVFDFIDSIYKNTVNEYQLNVADEIIKNQTAQYETLIKHDSEMHKLRHDHKNFCIGLLSELRAGNVDTAIESLTREYDIINAEHLMQSDIINSIVSIKRKAAEEHNAELHLNYNGANEINVAPTDLAIILGNALDNAIEACKNNRSDTPKIINMSVSVKNNVVYISMENPVQNTVDTKNLVSTKKIENEHHGFGIISMKQIAEKYNGEVLFSCEDNVFTTVIVLNNGKA